jgi:hypothetical protein
MKSIWKEIKGGSKRLEDIDSTGEVVVDRPYSRELNETLEQRFKTEVVPRGGTNGWRLGLSDITVGTSRDMEKTLTYHGFPSRYMYHEYRDVLEKQGIDMGLHSAGAVLTRKVKDGVEAIVIMRGKNLLENPGKISTAPATFKGLRHDFLDTVEPKQTDMPEQAPDRKDEEEYRRFVSAHLVPEKLDKEAYRQFMTLSNKIWECDIGAIVREFPENFEIEPEGYTFDEAVKLEDPMGVANAGNPITYYHGWLNEGVELKPKKEAVRVGKMFLPKGSELKTVKKLKDVVNDEEHRGIVVGSYLTFDKEMDVLLKEQGMKLSPNGLQSLYLLAQRVDELP